MPPTLNSARPLIVFASSSSSTSSSSSLASSAYSSLLSLLNCRRPLTNKFTRDFSTTLLRSTKTIKPHCLPSDLIPPYPYGERRIYKQSNRGLYGSARIRFGNNVAEKHNNKSRRFWRPNVHVKAFLVPSLGTRIKIRLTLRVLKTIRHEGGIENYLLKSKPARIKELGPGGWNLRWLLMQSQVIQQRFNNERVVLGLKPKELENRDDIIHYALDYATPGPLSLRSRATLGELQAAAADTFVLGDEGLADLEGIQELSDDDEKLLIQRLDEGYEVTRAKESRTDKKT